MASNGVSRHVPNSGLHNNSVYIVLSLGLTCASDKLINITCFLPLQKKRSIKYIQMFRNFQIFNPNVTTRPIIYKKFLHQLTYIYKNLACLKASTNFHKAFAYKGKSEKAER